MLASLARPQRAGEQNMLQRVVRWLETPIAEPPFNGRRPVDLLDTPEAAAVLSRLRAWLDAADGRASHRSGRA